MSRIEIKKIQVLLDKKDFDAIERLLDKNEHEVYRQKRIISQYPSIQSPAYKMVNFNLAVPYSTFALMLNQQKNHFKNKKISLLKQKQLALFDLSKPPKTLSEDNNLPSIILTGQWKDKKLNNYFGINYLDYENIERIYAFLIDLKLNHKPNFIQLLSKNCSKQYQSFLAFYELFKERESNEKPVEDLIWSLEHDEWYNFLFESITLESFYWNIQQLIAFYRACLLYKKDGILIRHSY